MYFRDAQLERDKNIFEDFFGRVIKRLKTLRSRPHTLTLQLVYLYCNMCRCAVEMLFRRGKEIIQS